MNGTATSQFTMFYDVSLPFFDYSPCFATFLDTFPDFLKLPETFWYFLDCFFLSKYFSLGSCRTLLGMDCFIFIAALLFASKPSIKVDNMQNFERSYRLNS